MPGPLPVASLLRRIPPPSSVPSSFTPSSSSCSPAPSSRLSPSPTSSSRTRSSSVASPSLSARSSFSAPLGSSALSPSPSGCIPSLGGVPACARRAAFAPSLGACSASRRSLSISRLFRAVLRRFVLHFEPPVASPFPAPSAEERRRFLRYRLLQFQQFAKQQAIPWPFRQDAQRKLDREKAPAEDERGSSPPASSAEAVRARGPLSRKSPSESAAAVPRTSASASAPVFSSFRSSFVDPRWRIPALWPAKRLLPPPPPPPEYVFAKSDARAQTADAEASADPAAKKAGLPLRIQAIGHGTFLIQCGGINVLTDPLFANKAGPFGAIGLPRVSQPGVALADLPPIDVVLLSSVRYDAYDHSTLRFLAKRDGSTFFVPSGVLARRYVSPRVFGSVYSMNWGERVKFDENFLVFFCPALHAPVGRYGFDWGIPGWGSFVLQWREKETLAPPAEGPRARPASKTVYYGGRSAYSRKMMDLIREGTRRDKAALREEMELEAQLQRAMEKERRRRRGEDQALTAEDLVDARDAETKGEKEDFVFDLAVLPIGGFEPREYMKRYQMSPEEAVDAHLRLESSVTVPSHFDVLPVGSEGFREAPARLIAACEAKGVHVDGFTASSELGRSRGDAALSRGEPERAAEGGEKKGQFTILEPGAHLWLP
ncbi:hypothetical protein BESB_010110 [Besnoitia besnoiti]|uniref:Metallo-beta-lactamase domain-containing protein n=1 Tax=Besnoitia besnoiti TaxID=94643 RepID=A0A2A9ML25_BESBE|nr:hypothetical protein BESB_010110 [Besnoitia besnoiti]PFH38669.1 hypothetical protein BESB_010110 [Besnoitia besnoiti]